MKNTFLNFYKTILEKVSFDKDLFVKEYFKARKFLNETEREDLAVWIKKQFNSLLNGNDLKLDV